MAARERTTELLAVPFEETAASFRQNDVGLPINDGKLLRPQDEPILAQVNFDWDSILVEALTRRGELRRQKWVIKQREQELIASKNFLLPTLDLVGRYRWRGLGRDLLKQHDPSTPTTGTAGDLDSVSFNNAAENLFGGNFQEWQLGFEFSMPIGNRRAHAAVEYAELLLSRERAILSEQEREVVMALSEVVAELSRTWSLLETSDDRRIAASEQLNAVQAAFDADKVNFDVLLDAQRRFLDAETNYHRSLVEYTIAVRNVHFEKGSLLDYNEVFLTEDLWPMQAYADGMRRHKNQIRLDGLNGMINRPKPLSAGPYNQNMVPGDAPEWENGSFTAEPFTPEPTAEPGTVEPQPLAPASDSAALFNKAHAPQSLEGLKVPENARVQVAPAAEVSDLSFLQQLGGESSQTLEVPEFMPDDAAASTGVVETFESVKFESPSNSEISDDSEFTEVAPLPPAELPDFIPPVPVDE